MELLHEDRAIGRRLQSTLVEPGIAPQAVGGYAQRTDRGWELVGGAARRTSLQTVFDLASVSKPFTALCAALLVSEGKMAWQTRLAELLPLARGTPTAHATVEELLSHRAGLKAHLQLFRGTWAHHPINRDACLVRAAHARGRHDRRTAVYSDMGYILAGEALSVLTRRPLDDLLFSKIFHPWALRLGSARAFRRSDASFAAQVAKTEVQPRRGGVLSGVVHDDNAWALSGTGCCGHAGLFGDVTALLQFGARFLQETADPDAPLCRLIRRRPGGTLRMGFDGVSPPTSSAAQRPSSAGALASPDTFGHLGFTGTSLWMDPARQRVTVLLTNRVFPTRNNPRLCPLRPQIHDFLWEC